MFQFDQILPAFFEAMRKGYVVDPLRMPLFVGEMLGAGLEITPVPVPRAKVIIHRSGDFRVMDCWFTTQISNSSSGFTNIWYKNALVWQMQYQGWYNESVIPFLKRALNTAYGMSQFVGGRGPNTYTGDGFSYRNTVTPPVTEENWRDFHGQEEVTSISSGTCLGSHRYQGCLMLSETDLKIRGLD